MCSVDDLNDKYLGDGVVTTYDEGYFKSSISYSGVNHPKGNTFIASRSRILTRSGVYWCDNGICICALETESFIYAAIHKRKSTELVSIKKLGQYMYVMHTIDSHVRVANIFIDAKGNIVFTNYNGVIVSLTPSDNSKTTYTAFVDTVGISHRSFISYSGNTWPLTLSGYPNGESISGYRHNCEWMAYRIITNDGEFKVNERIDEAFVEIKNKDTFIIILSGGGLHVYYRDTVECIPGHWLRAPINVYGILYSVRNDGVMIDLKTVWENNNVYYDNFQDKYLNQQHAVVFRNMIHNTVVM